MTQEELSRLQSKLLESLPEKRFIHTLGVQYTAANLAMCYQADMMAAQTAGLLHDCARNLPDEKILLKCRKFGLPISDIEERNPYLLHGKLGAYLAKKDYGVAEPDILGAIEWHTTGRPDMTLMEKIIFTADYIEPGRKIVPGLNLVRSTVYQNLDKSICLILKHTLEYLDDSGKKEVDPTTRKAYTFYKKMQI